SRVSSSLLQVARLFLSVSVSSSDCHFFLSFVCYCYYRDLLSFPTRRSSDLREISMKDVFRSGDSSKKFKIAEGQWYRYAPSYVSPAYHLLEGFPFIQEPPSGDLQELVLIRHHDYDQCFQSVQLLQWNSQVKFNVTVYRNLPTTRDSIMTS